MKMNSESEVSQIPSKNLEDYQIQPSLDDQEIYFNEINQMKSVPRNYGTLICFSEDKQNQPKYVLGPHYYVAIPTLLLCVWFLWYSIQNYSYKLNMSFYPLLLCLFSAVFFVISYLRVIVSNPGIASTTQLPAFQIETHPKYCQACKVLKNKQTRHCYYCDVCILEMDHHCVWIGNCIGKNNMNKFKIFIFSTILVITVFALSVYFGSVPMVPHIK